MSENGEPHVRLMVSGRIGGDEVHRGMQVIDESGHDIAYVAGVMVGHDGEDVTALLLGNLPPNGEYSLVPVDLVRSVDSDRLCLCPEAGRLDTLPRHEPD